MDDKIPSLPSEREDVTSNNESGAPAVPASENPQTDTESREALPQSETKDSKPASVDYAKIQEESWTKSIAEGEKSLEELEQKQPWLADRVKAKLGIQEQPKESFEDKMANYEVKREYDSIVSELEKLPTAEYNKIVRRAKEYNTDLGADAYRAMKRAWNDFADDVKNLEKTRKERVNVGAIDPASLGSKRVTYTAVELSQLGQAEYNRIRDLADKGEVDIV